MHMIKRLALAGATTFLLLGCVAGTGSPTNPLDGAELTLSLDKEQSNRLEDPFIRAGLEALEDGDYHAAQAGFNRALKFDPTNSYLHFLNGMTYHLRAASGDSSQQEYAAIGYRLALQYDSSNYWAAYQLGHINFNDQRYREAQDAFAYALLFAPKNPTLLKALAAASYYAQDISSATSAIVRAEESAPEDAEVLRMAALFNAAGNRTEHAETYLAQYNKVGGIRPVRLRQRVTDWQNFHVRNDSVELAQNILGDDNTTEGVTPDTDDLSSDDSDDSDSDDSDSDSDDDSDDDKPKKVVPPKMVMVDVVIIRSEERLISDKGVNLLSGLSATLGGTTVSYTGTRTVNDSNTGANTNTNVFTYAPTLSVAASYSLNIFNDNNDSNEVLARPSLIATDGKKSEFFTGSVFHVQLTGAAGSQGTVTDVPVGIRLDVTPKFLNDDQVQLNVSAARAFIESRSSQIGFSNFAQTTKNVVTANVTMKFGNTLVISGLSEKETEKLNDGVPVLQNIPGLQYLFSHEDTLEYRKSVLILLTPRKPRFVHEDGSPKADPENPADADTKQPNLDELKNRPGWFKPAPNLNAVFNHLKDKVLFKEFRTGDVALETWAKNGDFKGRLRRMINFMYY